MKFKIIILFSILSFSLKSQNDTIYSRDTSLINLIIDFGKTYEGKQYQYGSCSSLNKGFDCSGFIYYIFKMGGLILPRSSREMSITENALDFIHLKKGDLLFFDTMNKGKASHVGIVSSINSREIVMLHVSSSKGVQEIDIIQSNYWYSRFLYGRSIK